MLTRQLLYRSCCLSNSLNGTFHCTLPPLLHTQTCSAKQGLTHCSVCPCGTGISCTSSCGGGSLFLGGTRRQLCTGLPAQLGGAGCVLPTSLHSLGLCTVPCHMAAAGVLRWGGCHQREWAPEATPWTTCKPDIPSRLARLERARSLALLLSRLSVRPSTSRAMQHRQLVVLTLRHSLQVQPLGHQSPTTNLSNASLPILASLRGEVPVSLTGVM